MKNILQDFSFSELENLIVGAGEKPYRARQVYEGLMRGKKISALTSVPSSLKEKLLCGFEDEPIAISQTLVSSDGTEKYLFTLADGNIIEGVLMKYTYGNTQCVSTQVGCRMGCKFCASTLGGLARNLTAGEILSQVLAVNAAHGGDTRNRAVTNIVLMGSGEPLDNYGEVVKFLKNVSAAGGINVSPRNISLSTCGLVPQIYALAEEGLPVNLTVSLHHVTDEGRARLMPVAKRFTIAEILKACDCYFAKTGRRYIFEYSLVEGENCSAAHAEALVKLLSGKPCHVNLIRLNGVDERDLKSPDEKSAYRFLGLLTRGGLSATLRRRLGDDIGGACGQLRASKLNGEV